MKKTILILSSFLFLGTIYAQQTLPQIPNSNFEDWENVGTSEVEPLHWSSLKTADKLAQLTPEVIRRTDGHTGDYGVRLEVPKEVFNIVANGILTNGRVHANMDPEKSYVYTDVSNPQWNFSFHYRPDSLIGWYKYRPESGDHGKIEVLLHTGSHARMPKDQETKDHQVGNAKLLFTQDTGDTITWKRFSVPFHYYKNGKPDYLLIVANAGDSTIAKVGSTLWLDDLQLKFPADAGITQNDVQKITVTGYENKIHFDMGVIPSATYTVYNLTGRIIQTGNANPTVPFLHDKGIYIVRVEANGYMSTKKLYIGQN